MPNLHGTLLIKAFPLKWATDNRWHIPLSWVSEFEMPILSVTSISSITHMSPVFSSIHHVIRPKRRYVLRSDPHTPYKLTQTFGLKPA